jgi:hypothetical protein
VSKSKPQTPRAVSWWLGGEEECPHCHQLYAYEIEVRCPECDGPSCPHCVARLERGVVCIVCSTSPAETEEASRG